MKISDEAGASAEFSVPKLKKQPFYKAKYIPEKICKTSPIMIVRMLGNSFTRKPLILT